MTQLTDHWFTKPWSSYTVTERQERLQRWEKMTEAEQSEVRRKRASLQYDAEYVKDGLV